MQNATRSPQAWLVGDLLSPDSRLATGPPSKGNTETCAPDAGLRVAWCARANGGMPDHIGVKYSWKLLEERRHGVS